MKYQTCKHAGRAESFQRSYTNEESEVVLVECKCMAFRFLVFSEFCEECPVYEQKTPDESGVS